MKSKIGRSAPGIALSEYALILSTVALIAIPALIFLSGGMSQHLNDLLHPKSSVASATIPTWANTQVTHPPSSAAPAAGDGLAQVTITTANGNTLTIADYSTESLQTQVATAGANGTTTTLANHIKSLADQLLAAGEIDQAQYNGLVALANKGHQLAELVGLMEGAATTAGDKAGFQGEPVTYNGQALTVGDLNEMLGFWQPPNQVYKFLSSDDPSMQYAYTDIPADPLNPPYGAKGVTGEFLDLYKQLEQSGALDDPAIKAVVQSLSSDIVLLSEAADQAYGAIHLTEIPPAEFQQGMMEPLAHDKAAGICETGNGQDSGIQCTG